MISRFLSRHLFIALLFSLAINTLIAQKKNSSDENELTLGQLLKIAREITIKEQVEFKRKTSVENFDFLRFTQVAGVKSRNHFDVFYDQNENIVKISKFSELSEDNFDFFILQEKNFNFQIILINEYTDFKHTLNKDFINGFIVRYKNECYFFGRSQYGGKTFFDSSKKISAFMKLNSSLRPVSSLKFSNGILEYYSKVNYKKNDILSESIFKPMHEISINDNISLSTLIVLLNQEKYRFKEDRKIGLVEELAYLPLWIYEGNHVHR